MRTDPPRDPWSGTTYNGFAGGPGSRAAAAPPGARRSRPSTRALLLGGVGAALALGLVFGLLARPQLNVGGAPAASSAASAPSGQTTQNATAQSPTAQSPTAQSPTGQSPMAQIAPPDAEEVPIAVTPPPPDLPQPRAQGRLEVLPPELARASRPAAQARAPTRDAASVSVEAPTKVTPVPTPSAPAAAPPQPAIVEAPVPAPMLRASFDCAAARPGAEQAVCSDPGLAAADRQLARVYRRALRLGVDPDLRQEQLDWIGIREDAARHSRRALASVYAQRIAELSDLVDNGPPPDAAE